MEQEVSLIQMLDARERRVWHQQELLGAYGKPLVCFTMNIAGPVKDSPLIRRGFARGRQLPHLRRACQGVQQPPGASRIRAAGPDDGDPYRDDGYAGCRHGCPAGGAGPFV